MWVSIKSDRWIRRMARRAPDDRAVLGQAGPRRRDLLRALVLRLRRAHRGRVQDLHQHQLDHRRPQELRPALVRRLQGRRLHHPAQLLRPRPHRRVLPHPAQRAHGLRREVHLRALRHHRERDAVRAGVGGHRHPRGLEHHAAARQDLRERGHRPGALLRERRGVRDLLRGQEGQVPGPAEPHPPSSSGSVEGPGAVRTAPAGSGN